ncbi:mRNA cleavage and polyadenylation specificity factor complex subunit [Stachybotrys elegans]|uniref:mRNA cleavage and polyadenylation specificity factor complex subunit n=1 Tax=Stachybotrys elegans TaxID=80388 RepID=A0A8K0WYH6_9HYPO|nr:mRNA cleavage and polyadenylation specificity factor complex subunit [Stachybotrys elegans]
MSTALSVPEQIRQLNDARKLVLSDVKYYPSVVRGILDIIPLTAPTELRRWGADFLAEAFATPALPNGEKETMQPYVLTRLEEMVENEREDLHVLRSAIQAMASIYPLAMRWIINNGYDTVTWERMVRIKQRILQIWDKAPPPVRICCIKFAQRVVLAQSVASGAEIRYGGTLDVSLDKVPPNHQSLDPRTLEAEATGLLDRMLSTLQESSDALVVDATLNCLSILVRTRPGTSNRIVNALLSFNPLKLANSPMTPKSKVMIKSMEKTTRLLLIHLTKRDPHNPMVPRIQQHVERMMRSMMEIFDEAGRKRPHEPHPQEAYEAKRQRVGPTQVQIPPLGPGPHSLADVFTLIGNDGLRTFDISRVAAPLVAKIAVSTLSSVDAQVLAKAVAGIRGRLETIASAPAPELNPNTAPLGIDEDEDDYEPDLYQAEDTEQILNKLDSTATAPETDGLEAAGDLALKSFSLPQPPELTPDLALSAGNGIVLRVLDMMRSLDEGAGKKQKAGFLRLAATSGNREAWMTILTRFAIRSSLDVDDVAVKEEGETALTRDPVGSSIRDVVYNYIMEDFRKNIDVAVSWLCEEWYTDKLQHQTGGNQPAHYEECTLRLIDGFLPYLHPQDKILTRFLSEIPELNVAILSRVKQMCRDPSVVQLALTSLLYLVMMRPPVKEIALDTVQDIWTQYDEARPMAGKYLSKYRPGFIEAATQEEQAKTSETPAPAIST